MSRFTVASENNPIQGALLRAMAAGKGELTVASLRALSPLSDKAQVVVDRAVVEVGLQRLTVAADLMAAGLTYPLNDPLSLTQVEWDSQSQTGGAMRTMNPSARGENQLVDVVHNRVPVYLTTDDFNIGIRTLKMSQRVGQPLDTTHIKAATRRVNESIEDAVINGSGVVTGGYQAYGILNAPNVNTATITTSWDDAASIAAFTMGPKVIADVLGMVNTLQGDKKYGPYNIYVGTAYGTAIENDFKANGDLTIKQRIEQITAGGRPIQVRVADLVPYKKVAMVQMTEDVAQIIDGQRPTVIPWASLDGFTLYWLVMAIMIPRMRSDYDGNSGICVGTAA